MQPGARANIGRKSGGTEARPKLCLITQSGPVPLTLCSGRGREGPVPDVNEFHPSPLSAYRIQGQSGWGIPRGATRRWEHSTNRSSDRGRLGCAPWRVEAPGQRLGGGGTQRLVSCKTEHLTGCLEDGSSMERGRSGVEGKVLESEVWFSGVPAGKSLFWAIARSLGQEGHHSPVGKPRKPRPSPGPGAHSFPPRAPGAG